MISEKLSVDSDILIEAFDGLLLFEGGVFPKRFHSVAQRNYLIGLQRDGNQGDGAFRRVVGVAGFLAKSAELLDEDRDMKIVQNADFVIELIQKKARVITGLFY
ncbi:hypothetical protein J3P95_04540 [Pseudomonas sp. Z5-35]|uniref:hypothetical protein n=1 Tax=unclassified Pseudomonas TaxID=196821 RepID=UPI003DA86602